MSIPARESVKSGGRSLPPKITRCFLQGLTEELGKYRGREILARVQTRYSGLLGYSVRYPQRALRMHLETNILPGLALYQVLREEGINQAPALEVVDRIIEIRVEAIRKKLVWVGKFAFFYHLVRWSTRTVMRVGYPAAGWKVEWLEVGPKQVAFNIHRCFYREVLTSFGAAELTSSFCRGDDLLYKDASPHLRFERTRTIGRGDDCCDFRFVRTRPS
jgi:L-2-amino-thiazoline-4-carboxylic acid hydrolase-like protein